MGIAKIYLVCEVVYDYSHRDYERCDIAQGTDNLAAFTLPELAEDYCRELTVKYFRENSINFSYYIPDEGWSRHVDAYRAAFQSLGMKEPELVKNQRLIQKEIWKDRTDQEVWTAAKILGKAVSFYCVSEVDLIA